MQQPYHSSPPESGGVPQQSAKRPAQASSQHADAHIPRRSSCSAYCPCYSSIAAVPASEGPEQTFRVTHPVLSVISWLIAAASAVWLVILGVSLVLNVASGVSHDSEFMMLTYGVYMACAFGFCCFGTFFCFAFWVGVERSLA